MTSKERITDAAIRVFAEKGRHGAKMETIAKTAQINKAMIYYLFDSKDSLYWEMIKIAMDRYYDCINRGAIKIDDASDDHEKLLQNLVDIHFDFFSTNQDYAQMLLEAITCYRDEFENLVKSRKSDLYLRSRQIVAKLIDDGIRRGVFREIQPEYLLNYILGMNLAYYIMEPFRDMSGKDQRDDDESLERRKRSMIELVSRGIILHVS